MKLFLVVLFSLTFSTAFAQSQSANSDLDSVMPASQDSGSQVQPNRDPANTSKMDDDDSNDDDSADVAKNSESAAKDAAVELTSYDALMNK